MKKTVYRLLSVLLATILTTGSYLSVHALANAATQNAYYVSSNGSDNNNCSLDAPCKNVNAVPAQPGDTITLLSGVYTGRMDISQVGTPDKPITITGDNVVFDGGYVMLTDSEWVIFEGLTFKNADNSFDVQTSHYITWRNNVFDYITRGLYIRGYSSHLLIENNEFYQSCSMGKTWSELKGSICEGGAVYGSSYGGGTYHIRNNYVHDAFNGFLFTDDSDGKWMNANVFIYGNRFERITDDPVEPEGDSFNFQVFNNTMLDTHRMISITDSGLGPIFVYNNVQITTGNPTGEASRLNSAFKIDQSNGFSNGVWLFNNTIVGNTAANFSAYDILSRSVGVPFTVRNNIYVTNLDAFNKTPSDGSYDYDMSLSPFGLTEQNGTVTDPMLNADGRLSDASPAHGMSAEVDIPTFFASSPVVPAGADLGGFQSLAFPAWVTPPDYPSQIPADVAGWPDNLPVSTESPIPPTATTEAPTEPPATETPTALPDTPTATPTVIASPTPTATETELAPTPTATATEPVVEPSPTDPPVVKDGSTGETIYDETDSAFVYESRWKTVTRNKAYGGSFRKTLKDGASVSLNFTGQSFSVIYKTGSAFRTMEVYVDGQLVGTIDQQSDKVLFQQSWDYPGQLPYGDHTLKLVFVADPSIKRSRVSLDAVIVR